ncbi:serine palmitoyltransferase [Dichomitus squalens LYAD-421 SS1]|uniref:serine C-palmitoyltransferase n=2 Tax=Dichomitus squalens TaxID=114155 RepID=A0A4Q9PVN6_9APHY|nr:serine palmitoyltransferase [Dichomitus squalens LYAD-421 SS1]EJF56701.1 serine palmitoyltransferase [Dichomitus squalens LYAD-421 SS1]TBU58529.1 serine palmitoyltransferase [Dichomitus squalens]
MSNSSQSLELLFTFLSRSYTTLETNFFKIPGSAVVARYVKSSHQNDPGRTLLEAILIIFAIRTLLQSRTRGDQSAKHFIQFDEKEIDELVDEWTPEPLAQPLSAHEQAELASVPVIVGPNGPKPKLASGKIVTNLASYNFTGLAGNEEIKVAALDTLKRFGLGSCGPPGFYGTQDVHIQLEKDIADFLGTEASIIYSQAFATISSVIPAFCKRGDIIVADRGVNFAIQKGLQISRCTIRWYDHNDMESLEHVLESVEKERQKRKSPLTRRFIVTEGIFDHDGAMSDLPKLVELKKKYKYRLILDETLSFGSVGRTGRGLTELYNVPASEVDMLVGSMATGLSSCGGFCAGSHVVVNHQRINGTSFVFSASMPALLTVAASEGINVLRNSPSILTTLQENVRAVRAILDRVDCIHIPSHPASAVIHLQIRWPTLQVPSAMTATPSSSSKSSRSNPLLVKPRDPPQFNVELEERLLQEVVDEALAQGVLITRAKRLRGQELIEVRPSVRLAVTAALSRKDCEKAAAVVKAAFVKVVGKRR